MNPLEVITKQVILQNMPTIIFWKNRNSVYIGANDNFLNGLGYASIDHLRGKTDYDLPCSPLEAKKIRELDKQVLKGTKIINTYEERWYEGKKHSVLVNKVPLLGDNEEIVGILGMHQIISSAEQFRFPNVEAGLAEQNFSDVTRNSEELFTIINNRLNNILTKRECECLSLWVSGYSLKECAKYLKIAQRTIETHRGNIIQKMNLSRKGLVIEYLNQKKIFYLFLSMGEAIKNKFLYEL